MTSKAKAKGNSGERELCGHLQKVFGGSFIRVPNSGAYIGGKNAFRKEFLSETQVAVTKGDIIPPDHMPKFVIECKFYQDFNFHQLLIGEKNTQLETWIKQTIDCVEEDDFWVVAFKINRKGWFICFKEELAEKFDLKSHAVYHGVDDTYIVADLLYVVQNNKEVILELTK